MKRLAFLVAFLFTLSASALAQSPDEITPEYVETLERQVEAVEAQNEILREQSSSMLTVATWAIGVVVGVVVIAFGVTTWMSYRYSEREKDIFLADLQSQIDDRFDSTVEHIDQEFKNYKSGLYDEVDENIGDLAKLIDDELDMIQENIYRVEFETKHEIVSNNIWGRYASFKESYLIILARLFYLAKDANREFFYDLLVDDLKKALERVSSIDFDTAGRLIDALDELPDKNKIDKAHLEELIEEKRTDKG